MDGDRREPLARYVLFRDDARQQQFVGRAEAEYQRLLRVDGWSGATTIVITPEAVVTQPRGLLRRAREIVTPGESLVLTASLAAAGRAALDVPGVVAERAGCDAERKVTVAMGDVVLDLLRQLAVLAIEEQREHPATRQTLRVAAELHALDDTVAATGCADPSGCVALRKPEQWGRRLEDAEVAEVRAVLAQLADHIH